MKLKTVTAGKQELVHVRRHRLFLCLYDFSPGVWFSLAAWETSPLPESTRTSVAFTIFALQLLAAPYAIKVAKRLQDKASEFVALVGLLTLPAVIALFFVANGDGALVIFIPTIIAMAAAVFVGLYAGTRQAITLRHKHVLKLGCSAHPPEVTTD